MSDRSSTTTLRTNPGFTTVELIMVVVVVGILAAVAIPGVRGMLANSRLNSASTLVRSTLTVARSKAVANPAVHCGVFFHQGKRGTICFFDDDGDNSYDSSGTPDRIYMKNLQPLPPRVIFSAVPANNTIIFRGDGSARTTDSVTVRSLVGSRTKMIRVNQLSGEATIAQ